MFSLYKFDSKKIYKKEINSELKQLTNSGKEYDRFGSSMLDGLCDRTRPIKTAYVMRSGICGAVVAWGAVIQDHSNISGHIFVNPNFRNNGLATQILKDMYSDYNGLIFYPTSSIGFNLFSKYCPKSTIEKYYLKTEEILL
jgi:hypothetical protein